MIKKFWNSIDDRAKQFLAWSFIIFIVAMLAVLLSASSWFKKPPRSNPPRATFKKADYSSDRSWLECRDHQLLCLYGGLWEELSSREILELCGHEQICDDLFGDGIHVKGGKK